MVELRRSGGVTVHPDQVQWCLTVPAMWSDAAKSTVRQAALRAGLIRQLNSDALQLILEPEAAALHVSSTGGNVRPGDVCLVVDAGGGTVDVTLHRVVGQLGQAQLAEAAVGAGERMQSSGVHFFICPAYATSHACMMYVGTRDATLM